MATIEEYYARLRQQKEALRAGHPQGYLCITSLANTATGSTAGTVCEASIHNAAIAILAGNGRESTPEEIEAHQNRGRCNHTAANAQTQKERQPTVQITEIAK